jgi:pilus assembly protein CpaF
MVDARLQDGSRVNVIIRPLALVGPTITVQILEVRCRHGLDRLAVDQQIAEFMRACVITRLNMVISGGAG